MNFRTKIIYGFLLLCFHCTLNAQTVKRIEVSGNTPYVDHIALMPGSSDMDLLVKIAFDEPNNSLTISLISYRKLFVFQSDVRYTQAVRRNKLRPDRFPYVIASDEQATYKLTKPLLKSIKPKRKHIFQRWIAYQGLQPHPTDYKMSNDYIEQSFDILNKEADVSIALRDILVMNEPSTRKKPEYDLFFQVNLDRTYEIAIQRDPCFGKEEAIQAAAAQVENIRNSYKAFEQKFGKNAKLNTPASVKIFNQMKDLLLEQFPLKAETSECSEIQSNIDLYNHYVDSIQRIECEFTIKSRSRYSGSTLDLSADYILTTARKIDNNVNKWLLSSDKIERKDLENACKQAIDQIRSHVQQATNFNSSQRDALRIFYAAENYFRRTCVK